MVYLDNWTWRKSALFGTCIDIILGGVTELLFNLTHNQLKKKSTNEGKQYNANKHGARTKIV